MSKEINTPQNNSDELDLGQLFKLIGRAFDRLFSFAGRVLNKLFLAFVWIVFFTKKHFMKLIVAGIIGLLFGIFKEKTSEPVYTSSIIVKQNYSFGESLYNTINYYQGLLGQKDYATLARELSIDSSFVMSISSIEIEAVISGNERLVEYSEYTKRLDSVLSSNMEYDDYLSNVEDYIYRIQKITINSITNDNFENVYEAVVATLNSNVYLKREKTKDIRELENRELAINKALVKSDSLQNTYKKILEFESQLKKENASQTSITIEGSENKTKTKEFDLYKSDIQLRKELVTIQREKENKEFILEILSNTPTKGFVDLKIEILGKSLSPKLFFMIIIPFILFSALLVLRFFSYLENYKNEV